jgi:carboxyl-terminal processing protease
MGSFMHRSFPRVAPASSLLLVVVAFGTGALLAFPAGLVVERSGLLPGRSAAAPADLGRTFDPFWEAWNLVEKNYVDKTAVDRQKMTRGAIAGMLESLGDNGHTGYLTPEEYQEENEELEGEFIGIGVVLGLRKQQTVFTSVMPNSPAERAGVKAGDVLLQVDGQDVPEPPGDWVRDRVRGRDNTPVRLRLRREGEADPIELTVTRGRVELQDVTWHLVPGQPIAYVVVASFGQKTHAQLKEAIQAARGQGARGLLLDVRGNPGGELEACVAVTSEFLNDGNVLLEQDSRKVRTPTKVRPGGTATDLPLCVLINKDTVSAAEIFAGAVQDHHRGKLVGTTTFGTGTVLQPYELSDGSAVMLAVKQWLTPDGRQIWHKGIQPDVQVDQPTGVKLLTPDDLAKLDAEALASSADKQFLQALEELKKALP